MKNSALESLSSEVVNNPEVDRWTDFFTEILNNERLNAAVRKSGATSLSLIPHIAFEDPHNASHTMTIALSLDPYNRLGLRFYESGKYAVRQPEQFEFDISWILDPKEGPVWKEHVYSRERPQVGDLDDRKVAGLLVRAGAKIPTEDQIIEHWKKTAVNPIE